MKGMKIFGLIIFLSGFGIFLASFFLGSYTLSTQNLAETIGDTEKSALFLKNTVMVGKQYNNNITFIRDLTTTLNRVNSRQVEKYGLADNDLQNIIKHNSKRFDLSTLSKVFDDTPVGRYKQETFRNYGGWLDGRKFQSPEELRKELRHIKNNINTYQLLKDKGFDKYHRKDLRYALTRAAVQGPIARHSLTFVLLTYGLCIMGAMLYILPKAKSMPGIKNDGIFHRAMTSVGWLGILTGTFLIAFYIILYFFPEYMVSWIIMVDPISQWLKGSEAGRFFLYGLIYTLAILVMGVRMLIKYRHSKYHLIRTASVMFFQLAFAFLIPEILLRLNQPYFDFKNIWPLDYDFFFESELDKLMSNGTLGIFMLGWGIALIVIAVPVFVYFFGKRWYCSWVCGCGGLAETLGDPYRQLSDKSLRAWQIERWMVHGILVFAVVMTAGVLYTYWSGQSVVLGIDTYSLRSVYGAWVGAGFAGVVGTGFYPLMGNRVWCRFGCPLAAYLGIIQRFKSRFRITTNGGQCISCGNCSTYCEMGIDVRWYAQRGQNIVRASCVGCGVCSSVCPRGVLNLENKDPKNRFNEPVLIGNNSVRLKNK